ncbi:MAG: beta-N-acetylhexosaminidase [Spirochaetaceae bacterium]
MTDTPHRAAGDDRHPNEDAPLVPEPKRRTAGEGSLATTPALRRAVAHATLSALPDDVVFESPQAIATEPFRRVLGQDDEAYRLIVAPTGIRVIAEGARGRLWALRTLLQLLHLSRDGTLRTEVIDDWPDLRDRGVLLDVSRTRVPRMETLCALIDFWSRLKLNQLQLYMEHTFAYPGHETVWWNASPFTAEELRWVDAFCRDRGIELVPNQNSLGHMERWLRHPEYRHLAECPEGFPGPAGIRWPHGSCLNPADPESSRFVMSLFDELLPNFTSRTVNIGGDEPWELGTGRSVQAEPELDRTQLYLRHVRAVAEPLRTRGYTVQLYGDVLAESSEILSELPEGVTVLEWGYEADHPFAERAARFAALNRDYLLVSGTSSWNGPTGRLENALKNTLSAVRAATRFKGRGVVITDWGDNGHTQQLPISLPPWVYAAGAAWGPEENAEMDLAGAVRCHALGTLPSEVTSVLMDLGYLHRDEPEPLPNATFLGAVLLPGLHPYYGRDGSRFVGASFAEVERKLEEIGVRLSTTAEESRPAPPRGAAPKDTPGRGLTTPYGLELQSQVIAELRFAHGHASIGAALCRMILEWGDGSFGSIPAGTRRDMARRVGDLEQEYRALWLGRSRIGGLEESLLQFRRLQRLLTYHAACGKPGANTPW